MLLAKSAMNTRPSAPRTRASSARPTLARIRRGVTSTFVLSLRSKATPSSRDLGETLLVVGSRHDAVGLPLFQAFVSALASSDNSTTAWRNLTFSASRNEKKTYWLGSGFNTSPLCVCRSDEVASADFVFNGLTVVGTVEAANRRRLVCSTPRLQPMCCNTPPSAKSGVYCVES